MRSSLIYFLFVGLCASSIIVTEVMYNPRQGNDFQFIEFYNTDSFLTDITGWTFTFDKFSFTFPSASIAANSFVILANKKDQFLFAYPNVPASLVFGDMPDDLETGSGKLNLKKADGKSVLEIKYKDSWYPLTDGYGPSLELICNSVTDFSDSNSWRASSLYTISDPLLEYSGSPNAASSWYSCPPPKTAAINLKFSEIMYKPIKEMSKEDNHEWLEIYNPDSTAVPLDGFRIVAKKGMRFAFPKNAIAPANSYIIIAKNPAAFTAVYGISGSKLFGGFSGKLSNGGDKITLVDSNGMSVEEIEYDSKWPYPIAADGQSNMPQYKGLSIERVTFSVEGTKSYNWVASVPTPGSANNAARATPYPIVTEKVIYQNGVEAKSKLAPSVSTNISVKISPKNTFQNVRLEYFADDINVAGESINSVAMVLNSDGTYTYNFPNGFPAKTILRFRVKADLDGLSGQIISHRSNDPIQWHGIYFSVPAAYNTASTVYEIMITKTNWTELWTNMRTETRYRIYLDDPSSGKCCIPNENWNKEGYAVLAYKGQIYDVELKYMGSNYNRMNGQLITRFDGTDKPTQPDPLRQLSWKIKLADYDSKIGGRDEITIMKPKDGGCSFLTAYTVYELARQLGIPAAYINYAQLYINGGYYVYGMDVEEFSSDMMEKFIEENNNKRCRNQPTMEVPFIYKANGFGCDGLHGLSNWQILRDTNACGATISANTRYENAYNLQTEKSYGTVDRIANLTFYMATWNRPYSLDFSEPIKPATKNFMTSNFDVNMVLNYIALINYAGAWDDITINYMVNIRQDGKASMATWDADALFGGNEQPCSSPGCSLFLGEEGAPVSQYQQPGASNNLKNAIIKTFRAELLERYRVLAKTVLSAENVAAILTNAQNSINVTEWVNDPNWLDEAPMRGGCLNKFKSWTQQRTDYIKSTLGEPASTSTFSVCPDIPTATHYSNTYKAAPGNPDAPTITKSGNSANIMWTVPNSNGAPITSMILQRSVDNGDFTTVYSGMATSYVDNDFSASRSQRYRVQAVNSVGASQYSPIKSSSDATTPSSTSTSTTGKPSSSSSSSGSPPSPLTTGSVAQPLTTGSVPQPLTTGSVPKPSTTGASVPPPSGPCTSGYMKCVDRNSYSTCDRGAWAATQYCGAGTMCSPSGNYIYCVKDNGSPPPSTPVTPPPSTPVPPSTPATTGLNVPSTTGAAPVPPPSTPVPTPPSDSPCTAGYMKCLNTNTYSTCNRGAWGPSQSCSSGTVCSPSGNFIYCVKPTRDAENVHAQVRSEQPRESNTQTNERSVVGSVLLSVGLFALVTVAAVIAIVGYRRVASSNERNQQRNHDKPYDNSEALSPKFQQLKKRTSSSVLAGKA